MIKIYTIYLIVKYGVDLIKRHMMHAHMHKSVKKVKKMSNLGSEHSEHLI